MLQTETRPQASVSVAYAWAKDAVDVALALVLLVLVLPLVLLVAITIKLETPGPVLFVQERYGVRRRRVGRRVVYEPARFRFYKFRSMVQDADESLHQEHIGRYLTGALGSGDACGPVAVTGGAPARFKLARDPRITRVGRVIRRMSIDELPQLLNVFRREMSLVGPRPVPLYEGQVYLEEAPWRFGALPGITGLWQVSGRCDLSSREMLDLDRRYVLEQSLALDAKILARTLPAVLSGRGAG